MGGSLTLISIMAVVISATAIAYANEDSSANNPYSIIATRNVFGLQPLPPQNLSKPDNAAPLPQIALKGITTVLGSREALFNVIEQPTPGQAAGKKNYILAEGELQDGIEVSQVLEKTDTVVFNNHGTIQEIALGQQSAGPPPMLFHHPF